MDKNNYGSKPHQVVVLHGGPGGVGDVRDVTEYIAQHCIAQYYSVIEPFMIQKSVDSVLEGIEKRLDFSAVIVGYSWGAMMALLFADRFPEQVKKLILIGCPPLDVDSEEIIMNTRLDRLNSDDRQAVSALIKEVTYPTKEGDRTDAFIKLKKLFDRADQFNPTESSNNIDFRVDVYEALWKPTSTLRQEGIFLKILEKIDVPITFIHGVYDPHPLEAIKRIIPSIKQPTLYVLDKCGHTPWLEKDARDQFFSILKKELS